MKKTLLRSLAALTLLGATLPASAQTQSEPAFDPENAPAIPTESGWYRIKFIELGTNYTTDALCNSLLGMYVVNLEEEYNHSSGFYSLGFVDFDSSKEAMPFVWLELSGTQYKAKSINGHYTNHQAIAQRGTGTAFDLTVVNEEQKGVAFGAGWTPFGTAASNFWGMSTQNPATKRNRYRITPVDVSGYDIYTVEIANASNGTNVKNDANVTCSNEANLGVASVYNGGNFFFPAGTTVTAADFTGTENNGITPRITVDAENKTIHAEYSLEGLYNHYVNTLNQSLTATGLLAENETVDYPAFNSSLTLDQNKTAAYDKAYDTAKSKLNGHKVYLRVATTSGNAEHDYLTVKEDGTVPQHKFDWTPLGAWTISFKTGNKVTLYNEVAKKYISNTAPTTAGDRNDFSMSETAFELSMFLNAEEATTHHGYFSFNTNGATTNTQVYMHAKSRPTIGKWGNAGDGSWWKFYLIDNEMEQGWIDELEAQISPAATPLGTNPGEWQVAEHPELHELQANWKEMTAEENLDYAKLYALTNAVATIPAEMTWTQNVVKAGHYYRIRTSKMHAAGANGLDAYFSNQPVDGSLAFIQNINITPENKNNTIFYTAPTDVENKFYLICLGDGKYVHATLTGAKPFFRMSTLSEVTSLDVAPEYAVKAYFTPVGADEATSMVFYYTTPGVASRSVHAWTKTGITDVLKSDMCGDAIETNANKVYHYYTIEQVNELPVAIGAQGYGAFVAPVPVSFEGHTVFSKVVTDYTTMEFQFKEMDENAVVPANTPVIVYGDANSTIYASIIYADEESETAPAAVKARVAEEQEDAPDAITVHGSHIAQAYSTPEGKAVYQLTMEGTGFNEGQFHFSKVAEGDAPVNTMLLTIPTNHDAVQYDGSVETAVITPNAAYTTGIHEVESAEQQGADVIYDLQGRRLNAPIRGLNIINGRKVLVK